MKENLVFLPGLLCDRGLFRHQLEVLATRYTLIVGDYSRQNSMAAMAEELLDQLPEKFSLCGHSMGGYIAFEMLRQQPERIERLALISSSPYADHPEQREFRQSLMQMAQDDGLEHVVETLLAKLIHPRHFENAELVRTVDAMCHRMGLKAFLNEQQANLDRPDSFNDLPKIVVPTLVCVGRQDQMTPPKVAGEMAGAIPNARLVEIENCGHLSPLEQPEALTSLLSYWMQTPLSMKEKHL